MSWDVRPLGRQLVTTDCTDRRVHGRGIGPIAGLHQVRASLVVSFFAHQRADDRQRVHLLGQLFQSLGQLDVLDAGGNGPRVAGDFSARLGVERFQLARSAGHPQHDERAGRVASLPGGGARFGSPGQQARHAGQPGGSAQPQRRAARKALRQDLQPTRSDAARQMRRMSAGDAKGTAGQASNGTRGTQLRSSVCNCWLVQQCPLGGFHGISPRTNATRMIVRFCHGS